jgi:phosphate uptake regulator
VAAKERPNEITLNYEDYGERIEQILFTVYYIGVENITVLSKRELTKDAKSRIRRAIDHMSGTEISYEDTRKITIRVLLDISRVDIIQVLYRIGLLIETSMTSLESDLVMREIRMQEIEIDRLYHLVAKIVTLALIDANVLHSSKIRNVSLIPSYFLISKKLENIADGIYYTAKYVKDKRVSINWKITPLGFLRKELIRCREHLLRKPKTLFVNLHKEELRRLQKGVKLKDARVNRFFEDTIRLLGDIEEETVNLSFYHQLIEKKVL